ncbi:hypothetical protein GR198_29595 [Rhizobium leguminosarum]|uniref:hypothetical protein n=1 Tax=Rhizobium leguminosarum TaxID=384 RepID=UPI0013BED58E|nr:hypothetical protein [Rhizobium leguminosarum]NEH59874.1 hypothetical protein [Rhizobium leguminosarum]
MATFIVTFLVAPAVFLIGWYFSKPLPSEFGTYRLIDWLSVIAFFMGYLGLVFSGYAALGVKRLSDRYFARVRLPDLRRKIDKLAPQLGDIAEMPADQAIMAQVFSEVSVQVAALQRLNGFKNRKLAASIISKNRKVTKWLSANRSAGTLLNECDAMWDLFRELNEISLHVSTSIEEEKAK